MERKKTFSAKAEERIAHATPTKPAKKVGGTKSRSKKVGGAKKKAPAKKK